MRREMQKKVAYILCCVALYTACLPMPPVKSAAVLTLSLEQAKTLALANSDACKKLQTKINLQKVKYVEAVKSVGLKQKDMLTFRWNPLLDFQFPEQPGLTDSYEWQYKPVQMQCELTALWHELEDTRYETAEQISNLYAEAYICQEKIAFLDEARISQEETLERNRARVKTGEAKIADVEKMEDSLEKLVTDVSQAMREMETLKKKITAMAGVDVRIGYRFENPLISVSPNRDALPTLVEHTLENDHGYYEAKLNSRLGLLSLETNEKLMKQHYKGKMDWIQSYVDQAKEGKEIDGDAFQAAYDAFLGEIEKPWNGDIRILFIKIPKDWFKGEQDGVRYIEDDPYILYTDALEYVDLKNEEDTVKSSLKTSVGDSFEAIVTTWNSYLSLQETAGKQETAMDKALLLNRLGELSYEGLRAEQDAYKQAQMEELEALGEVSALLYSFDRLTCGGMTKYISGQLTAMEPAYGGDSFLSAEELNGASYYIKTRAEDHVFLFGIVIPEDFSLSVSSFELWVNGTQVGERTEAGQELKHLTLALDGIEKAAVRLYDGEKFLDECQIDPEASSGELEITGGYEIVPAGSGRAVATYTCTTDKILGITEITFRPLAGEKIAFYQIQDLNGIGMGASTEIPTEESFSHLSVAADDLENIRAVFYDERGNLLYTARLRETTMEAVAEEG
nr:MAG TPA: Outer membrane protein [Caudoviricetes sp.]